MGKGILLARFFLRVYIGVSVLRGVFRGVFGRVFIFVDRPGGPPRRVFFEYFSLGFVEVASAGGARVEYFWSIYF